MSSQTDIEVTYDLSPEFYRLWLDERMIYSCALFEGTASLEAAQVKKLEWISDAARVTPDKRTLDIGCGWGGTLEFLAKDRGVRDVTGITLSPSQHREAVARVGAGATVHCISYTDYEVARPFDAVLSIGMFEHLASWDDVRAGRHLPIYRDYFRRVWEWTTPGAWFGLQSVITVQAPRDRRDIRDLAWGTARIFPGASSPRLEAMIAAATGHWEVMEVRTRREHYARTTAEWLRRLRSHEAPIRDRWGAQQYLDYERYLSGCVRSFDAGYQSLVQMALRRVDRTGRPPAGERDLTDRTHEEDAGR